MLKRIDVTLDKKKIGAALDRKETATGDVDTMSVLEVPDGGTSGGLELVGGRL